MSTCRFCKKLVTDDNGLKYGRRHYAHYRCYATSGKSLSDLHFWQVEKFPYRMLQELGLIPEVERLMDQHKAATS